eukprot:scaffold544_cov320-Pavlova_lutheri.AAC.11
MAPTVVMRNTVPHVFETCGREAYHSPGDDMARSARAFPIPHDRWFSLVVQSLVPTPSFPSWVLVEKILPWDRGALGSPSSGWFGSFPFKLPLSKGYVASTAPPFPSGTDADSLPPPPHRKTRG